MWVLLNHRLQVQGDQGCFLAAPRQACPHNMGMPKPIELICREWSLPQALRCATS